MFAVNTTLAFGAAMALIGWTSGEMIMYDAKKFMMDVMENDESWARLLNVPINVDVGSVSTAALLVLEKLKAVTPEIVKELEPKDPTQAPPAAEGSAAETADAQKTTTVREPRVVGVNALHVVADVVSLHADKGDALEFGLAVIASAVKCDVLQHIALQVHVIGRTLESQPAATNAARSSAVWDALVLFLDKLARLKESLAAESDLYRMWETVVVRLIEGTLKVDDLGPSRTLVDEERQSTCGNVVPVEQLPEKLGFDNGVENWDTEDGINAIFVKSQKALDGIFEELPISTMSLDLWNVYLNKKKLTDQMDAIAGKSVPEKKDGDDFVLVEHQPIHTE